MGVVVRRYKIIIDILIIINTFPSSTCISSFFGRASLLLCSFFKCVFVLYIRTKTHLKNEQRSRDALPKKELIQVE